MLSILLKTVFFLLLLTRKGCSDTAKDDASGVLKIVEGHFNRSLYLYSADGSDERQRRHLEGELSITINDNNFPGASRRRPSNPNALNPNPAAGAGRPKATGGNPYRIGNKPQKASSPPPGGGSGVGGGGAKFSKGGGGVGGGARSNIRSATHQRPATKLDGVNMWYDHSVHSSNNKDVSQHGYIWRSREKYFFPDLNVKLEDMTAGGNCMRHLKVVSDKSIGVPVSDIASNADLTAFPSSIFVSSFPPDNDLKMWWQSMHKPKQMRVDPWLCQSPYTKQKPIFNNPGCQLSQYMHHSAPRCQTSYLKWICERSKMDIYEERPNHFIVPESDHSNTTLPPIPFLITATNVLVSLCGDIVSSCGIVRMTTNCKANEQKWNIERFADKCNLKDTIDFIKLSEKLAAVSGIKNSSYTPRHFKCLDGTPWMNNIEIHDRVFVVAEVDDTYVYHIHLEIMPRIVYHLDFLLRNPDVKILIGCDTKEGNERTEAGIRHGLLSMKPLMDLAGLSMDRLIVHRHIFAREVYWPMEGGCQDPVYNTWQVLHMRSYFMDIIGMTKADIYAPPTSIDKTYFTTKVGTGSGSGSDMNLKRPTILLMKRSSNAKHTRNNRDSVRQWSDDFTRRILDELKSTFPGFNVKLFSDKNVSMMTCHPCQIREFLDTEVLIGMHGAGMANILYMRPNRAVVEIGPYMNDGRILLGGGPFSRTAFVMSHNYMIHHPPYEEFKWIKEGLTSEFNVSRLVSHVRSFLSSIDYI